MHFALGLILTFTSAKGPAEQPARFGDFAAYWTAGRCFIERQNNFDPQMVQTIENREELAQTFVVWNPPWLYPLLAPYACLPFTLGAIAWLLTNVALLVLSAQLVGQRVGLSPFWATVLGVTFVPAQICIGISQLSIFVLAGVVLCGFALQRNRPFLAGSALALAAIKPHLVGLVWLAILLIGPFRQRLAILSGLAVTLAAVTALAAAWNPDLIGHYLAAVANPPVLPPTQFYSATLGMWLRMETGLAGHPWVQFAPLAIAALAMIAWVVWHAASKKVNAWHAMSAAKGVYSPAKLTPELIWMLAFISIIVLPYGWHYDQAVLLPAYLMLWAWIANPRGEAASTTALANRAALAGGLILFEIGLVLMLSVKANERLYVVWPLLLGALIVLRSRRSSWQAGKPAPFGKLLLLL